MDETPRVGGVTTKFLSRVRLSPGTIAQRGLCRVKIVKKEPYVWQNLSRECWDGLMAELWGCEAKAGWFLPGSVPALAKLRKHAIRDWFIRSTNP